MSTTIIADGGATDPLETYIAYQASRAAEPALPSPDSPVTSPYAGAGADIHAAITTRVEGLKAELSELATDLYHHPEVGFAEHRSAGVIADLLERHGVEVERGVYGLDTAFRATAGSADGPHFAILAEYDALPGVGHACGHNIISGVAIGAFLAVRDVVERTGGRVSLIGTPAEEGGGGKEIIIEAGGFDDVDAAGMVHPGAGNAVSSVHGKGTSGVRRVQAIYHGRAAHAAGGPQYGLNALDAIVSAYQSIAQLRQHILPIDRIHGVILEGGEAPNVIPERTEAQFLIRSSENATLNALTNRVVAILESTAYATGTRAEIIKDVDPAYLPLEGNTLLNARWSLAVGERGRPITNAPALQNQGGPSTDMGNVSQYIPAIHPSLGLGAPEGVLPHNAAFADHTITDAAFTALVDSSIGLAVAAADFLADPELRRDAQAEFIRNGGRRRVADELT